MKLLESIFELQDVKDWPSLLGSPVPKNWSQIVNAIEDSKINSWAEKLRLKFNSPSEQLYASLPFAFIEKKYLYISGPDEKCFTFNFDIVAVYFQLATAVDINTIVTKHNARLMLDSFGQIKIECEY